MRTDGAQTALRCRQDEDGNVLLKKTHPQYKQLSRRLLAALLHGHEVEVKLEAHVAGCTVRHVEKAAGAMGLTDTLDRP